MNKQHYLFPGNEYLVKIRVKKDIEEEDRDRLEERILNSLMGPVKKPLFKGIETVGLFKTEYTIENIAEEAYYKVMEVLKERFEKYVENVKLEELAETLREIKNRPKKLL